MRLSLIVVLIGLSGCAASPQSDDSQSPATSKKTQLPDDEQTEAETPDALPDEIKETPDTTDEPIEESETDPPLSCPAASFTAIAEVQEAALNELSGIAVSRTQSDLYWVHEDSGASPVVYALDRSGEQVFALTLKDTLAIDWEDIAIGNGPVSGKSYIYIADIGDNGLKRKNVTLYRVEEPTAFADDEGKVTPDAFVMTYPNGESHNAETLMIDEVGTLYVVTKDKNGHSKVFAASAPLEAGVFAEVGAIEFSEGDKRATGGDIASDGARIAIRTPDHIYLWQRTPGQSVADALKDPPCQVTPADEEQGEAIGFALDGKSFVTVSEGEYPSLNEFSLTPAP